MFRIGMKVVCVDAKDSNLGWSWDSLLEEGKVYTVREVKKAHFPGVGEYEGVRLEGVVRECMFDTPYFSHRFRPVVEKKTDISWAEEILRRESIDTPERVS